MWDDCGDYRKLRKVQGRPVEVEVQAEVKAEAGETLWEVGREVEVGGTSREVGRRAETVWGKGVPLTGSIYCAKQEKAKGMDQGWWNNAPHRQEQESDGNA